MQCCGAGAVRSRYFLVGAGAGTGQKKDQPRNTGVVDPNILNLDPDSGFWPNLRPDQYCGDVPFWPGSGYS